VIERKGNDIFHDKDLVSGTIFYRWLTACGVARKVALNEINQSDLVSEKIGEKTFQQWTSSNESAKKISAKNRFEMGGRVVAIVRWFIQEHMHRRGCFIRTEDLEEILRIYDDIPVKNRLQLNRMLHDLKVANRELETQLPINPDWKNQLTKEPLCAFVMDRYWCLRATTHYELGFAGFEERDVLDWGCWHRLAASIGGVPKHSLGSPMSQTRGPYANEYYIKQVTRFRHSVMDLLENQDERLMTVLDLLNETSEFKKNWETSIEYEKDHLSSSIGFPVPFFRKDGTLIWMMELSTVMANTDNFQLVIWTPLFRDSNIYLADLLKELDESKSFSKTCYFIEDYAQHWTPDQRKALGV